MVGTEVVMVEEEHKVKMVFQELLSLRSTEFNWCIIIQNVFFYWHPPENVCRLAPPTFAWQRWNLSVSASGSVKFLPAV